MSRARIRCSKSTSTHRRPNYKVTTSPPKAGMRVTTISATGFLLIRDRMGLDELIMTQEFIANMLSGRRETVTVAAGRLQDAGLIHYSRGRLCIVDRKGLEDAGCGCYQAVRTECNPMPSKAARHVNVCAKSRVTSRISNALNWSKLSGAMR